MASTVEHWLGEAAFSEAAWLVTGAAGFIGSHCVETLLRAGQRVTGFDNFATGHRENLRAVEAAVGAAWKRFTFVEGDVRDADAVSAAMDGTTYVLHQAALASVPRSIADPLATHSANVTGTLNVFLSAAADDRVRRVVYASSSSVYGDAPGLPKVESRIGNPLSPYAASKRMKEIYAQVLSHTHGLQAVGLRYFNVIGARQDPNGPYAAVVPRWLEALRDGTRPLIFGDGETSRDFCPVDNVVQANLRAATRPQDLAGKVYNVALGGQTTLNQLFALLRHGMAERGAPCAGIEAEYREFREGDVRHSLADISAAAADLGYAPDVGLAEGLAAAMDELA